MMERTIGKNRAWSGRKRSFLLFFTMLFVLCMGVASAYAADNLCDGVSGFAKNQVIYMGKTTKEAAYDGKTAGKPVSWIVLNRTRSNDGNKSGMYLVSRQLLGKNRAGGGLSFRNAGDNSSDWTGSNADVWCQSFYHGALTSREKKAVLNTNINDTAYTTPGWGLDYEPFSLSGAKVFFLSAREADDYFLTARLRQASYNGENAYWLLRSPGSKAYQSPDTIMALTAGAVGQYGDTLLVTVYATDEWVDHLPKEFPEQYRQEIEKAKEALREVTRGDYAARPAFNLDRNKVLFSSSAKGGKLSEKAGVTGLVKNPSYKGSERKLTLLDSRLKLKVGKAFVKRNILYVPYSGASTGKSRYVSGVIKNPKGKITYYGRLAKKASGTIAVDLSSVTIGTGDRLYLFTEECNGDCLTDYAGRLKEVTYAKQSPEEMVDSYDAESFVPLTVENRSRGTVAIKRIDSKAGTILLTGSVVSRRLKSKRTKPVSAVIKGAFSKTTAKTVSFDLTGSATMLLFEKEAFAGSRVNKVTFAGKTANVFRFRKGAFSGSGVNKIIVRGMKPYHFRKLLRKLKKAGYCGKVVYKEIKE